MKDTLVKSEQINKVLHLTLNDQEHQNTLPFHPITQVWQMDQFQEFHQNL